MTQLNVKNLDYLGIIAAVVDELGLVQGNRILVEWNQKRNLA
jgi:hypothetical protein